MRYIFLLVLIIIALCSSAQSAKLHSTFTCDATDGKTTMTFYSYLKEPRLEETQYHQGFKSKSFDYLYKGKIKFTDDLTYWDGTKENVDPYAARLNVSRYDYVDFNGTHGISEVYDAAFYPNHKAVSAFKKIRYDDLSYDFSSLTGKYYDKLILNGTINKYSFKANNTYKLGSQANKLPRKKGFYELGDSTTAKAFTMEATAEMGLVQGYSLNYSANLKNATFEMNEATGWSNRTGARRTDWTQSALIKGDAKIRNLLEVTGYFFPAAGPSEDWLPCWYCGTIPTIEQNDSGWPSARTIAVLRADKLYPTTQLAKVTELIPTDQIPAQLALIEQSNASQDRMKWAKIGLVRLLPYSHLTTAGNCSSGACSLKNPTTLGGMNI